MRNFFLVVGGSVVCLALAIAQSVEVQAQHAQGLERLVPANLIRDVLFMALVGAALVLFGAILPKRRP